MLFPSPLFPSPLFPSPVFPRASATPAGDGELLLQDGSGVLLESGEAVDLENGEAPTGTPLEAEDLTGLDLEDGGAILLEGVVPPLQTFRAALAAKLAAISAISAIVGDAIYPAAIPETHDLLRDGPALVYQVLANPRGHHLGGSDGTSTARVQLSACGLRLADTDAITAALFDALDGRYNDTSWGNGTVAIMSCHQEDESDMPEAIEEGRDDYDLQIDSVYVIKHRVALPTLP